MNDSELLARGHRVLRMEAEAVAEAERRLGDTFVAAVRLLAGCTGRVIVTGVGKSGLIGHKLAATLTSTGTPATFLHPVESVHGDLGMVGADDIAILLSKSGETEELLALIEHLKRFGVRSIAITGDQQSTISRLADVSLDGWVREEACPHDLAPTTSTTVALALGDALAVALLEAKGFRREDFARLHPGGSLGRRLLTRVGDVMISDPLPTLPASTSMRQVVRTLASHRGIVMITNDGRLDGVFTAGDFTRLTEQDPTFLDVSVTDVMTRNPKVAESEELASSVVYRMERHGIMAMPVLNSDGFICGVVHLHDLMRAGVA